MYKLKILTLALFAALIAIIMSACSKDEPSVSMEITTEIGNTTSQFPYDYAEASITFACSEDFLELTHPSFAIISTSNYELIEPKREDFQLAENKSIVSLVEEGETVNREMPVYKYSFTTKLVGSEGALLAFALCPLNDNLEQNVREDLELYRGFENIDITTYCHDGQYTMSNTSDLYNIFGYKSANNIAINLINLYILNNQIPTVGVDYKSSGQGNSVPDFTIAARDLPYSEVLEYFNGLNPTAKINGSYSFGNNKAKRNEIINQFGSLLKNRNGILDVFSDFD